MPSEDSPTTTAIPTSPLRVFFGRVLPERADVDLAGLPGILTRVEGHDDLSIQLHVNSSCVVVETRGGATLPDATLKESIRGLVASFVDCLGFVRGCGYEVEMTSVGGDTQAAVFGVHMGEGDDDASVVNVKASALITLLLHDSTGSLIPLRRAFADYRRAILEPSDTPFHAFRAVESLTYFFDRNPRRGMPRLCSSLGIEEDWIRQNLEIPAGEIRHGKARDVDEAARLSSLSCARKVLGLFVTFVERTRSPTHDNRP
jgi:hypothetical protein